MSSIGSRPLKPCAAICLVGDQTFRPRASLRNLAIGQCTPSRIMRIACINPPAKISHLVAKPTAASDFGVLARPNPHLHAPQIADCSTDLRPTKDGVTFGRSQPRHSRRDDPLSTERSHANMWGVVGMAPSLFPGSFCLGLTLPFARLRGSALPLPVIPAKATPFDGQSPKPVRPLARNPAQGRAVLVCDPKWIAAPARTTPTLRGFPVAEGPPCKPQPTGFIRVLSKGWSLQPDTGATKCRTSSSSRATSVSPRRSAPRKAGPRSPTSPSPPRARACPKVGSSATRTATV